MDTALLKKTIVWLAGLICVGLLAFVLWWVAGGEKDAAGPPAAGKKEAVGSAPRSASRGSPGDWAKLWSLLPGREGSPPAENSAKEVEEAVRRTFLAYNSRDLPAFKEGWTEKGFQQAFELPKEKVKGISFLSLLSFRPYTIGEFSNTSVDGKSAMTEVALTYGEVQESHRMELVREEHTWKIDHDERLVLIPKDATVVNVKLKYYIIELERTRAAPGSVAFRIANADTRQHEFIVKRWLADSGMEETIGKIKPLQPGQNATLVLNLDPGRYIVLCNLLGADKLPLSYGMRAEFIIQ